MSNKTIFLPFPRELYDDLVRFSDGSIDPAELAAEKVQSWIDLNFSMEAAGAGWVDDSFPEWFGERLPDFAEKYAPGVLAYWAARDDASAAQRLEDRKPLIWKAVTVPAGSEVRMSYGGTTHFAMVRKGKIIDDDGEFSPSTWASKVANHTSRNAWRDLWFKFPGNPAWVPAQVLKAQADIRNRDAGAHNSVEEETGHA